MRPTFALALLSLTIATPTIGQAPATADTTAPDPALLAKAHQLIVVIRAKEQSQKLVQTQFAQIMKGASDQAIEAMPKQAGITDDPEFKTIFDRYMQHLSSDMTSAMTVLMPQMIDQLESIYARNFSARELDDMITFYQTPSGQAYIDRMPKVMGEYMTSAQSLMMPAIIKSAQPAMQQFTADMKALATKHSELKDRAK